MPTASSDENGRPSGTVASASPSDRLPAPVSARDELLVDLVRRQPFLLSVNLVTSLLFALATSQTGSAGTVQAWFGCVALAQACRLAGWLRWRHAATSQALARAAIGLVVASAATGIGWGSLALLSPGFDAMGPEQLLVPFFLAGMSAGAAATLYLYPPVFYAFMLPALGPYIVRLALMPQAEAHVMALGATAYAVGLGVLAYQAHRYSTRAATLYVENAGLVGELKQARQELERRIERHAVEFDVLMNTVPAAVWLAHDTKAERITSSRHASKLPPIDGGAPGDGATAEPIRLLRDGQALPLTQFPVQRAARGEFVQDEEIRVLLPDGSYVDELVSAAPVLDARGVVQGAVGAAIDITARKFAEDGLRGSEQRFRDFAAAGSDWFWETDVEHRFTWLSANVNALTRFSREAVYGKSRFEVMAQGNDPALAEGHRAVLASRAPFRDFEYLTSDPLGGVWVSTSGVPVTDSQGRFVGYRGVGRDISGRKLAEDRFRHLAHHDELTGLPNRALLQDRLRHALLLAGRAEERVALLLIDLDAFKDVNDAHGHPVGDALLRAIGQRLAAVVRNSDTLARLGGDEFAVLQQGVRQPSQTTVLAERLVQSFAAPLTVGDQEISISASLGVAVFPDDGADADELVRRADLALYRAKHDGRSVFRFFEPAMDAQARRRRELERELHQALAASDFVLHYQPEVELATGRIRVVEALVRWRHSRRGLLPPGDFIDLAESCGFILPLGEWVLDEACRQARAWRDAGLTIAVAINVSAVQLRHGGLLKAVDGALRAYSLDSHQLEIELTESLLLEQSELATDRTLRGLAARGIRLALDDFGTGYSSLSYLKQLPVQRIKIDRSFVRDIGSDPDNEAVVRAIVMLGHTLGKEVVAEGVETAAQLAFLRELRCDAAQGFLLGHPMEAGQITRLANTGAGAWAIPGGAERREGAA